MTKLYLAALLLCLAPAARAQKPATKARNRLRDSLYIRETENAKGPQKVLHAEPLYNDLARDLGGLKGEHELNLTLGMGDHLKYNTYETALQYAFVPVNRLGVEVKLPFVYVAKAKGVSDTVPGHRLEGLNFSLQWTVFVSEKLKTSMAVGYTGKFGLSELRELRTQTTLSEDAYSPFFIIAKRWGRNFHSMVYTGPTFTETFPYDHWEFSYQINTSFHYMIPGTRHFVGVEFNKNIDAEGFAMVVRPQLRLEVTQGFLFGIAAGLPVNLPNERFGAFVRLVYEPPAFYPPKRGKK